MDEAGVIRIVYHGNQTKTSLAQVIGRGLVLAGKLVEQDKPVIVLADIRDMGEHTVAARMTGLRARTVLPFWKMAIVTTDNDRYTAKISRIMTSMSGRRKEIRYFKREAWALRWLGKRG